MTPGSTPEAKRAFLTSLATLLEIWGVTLEAGAGSTIVVVDPKSQDAIATCRVESDGRIQAAIGADTTIIRPDRKAANEANAPGQARAAAALERIAKSLEALAAIAPKIGAGYELLLEHAPAMLELTKMAAIAAARDLGIQTDDPKKPGDDGGSAAP